VSENLSTVAKMLKIIAPTVASLLSGHDDMHYHADTHCACFLAGRLQNREHRYKFCGCPVANPCKSGEPLLHGELPPLKKITAFKDDFKSLKSVGIP
jgi:hypothetical protein